MHKITFFIYSLRTGGAERVISQLSNQLVMHQMNVEILTIENQNDFHNEMNKKINVRCLNKNRIINTIIPVFKYCFAYEE